MSEGGGVVFIGPITPGHGAVWAALNVLQDSGGVPVISNQTLNTTSNVTFNSLTLTSGIVGITDGSNAAAGIVGEFIESVVPVASPVTIISATNTNLTSLLLQPGDWDVEGVTSYAPGGAGAGSGTLGCFSLVSATPPNAERYLNQQISFTGRYSVPIPRQRFNFTVPTTVFSVGQCTFTTGPTAMYGYMNARRAR